MATEFTHVKFAHDICSVMVSSLSELYSGAVYPDSRYITGASRDSTHANCPADPFAPGLTDFERGWASHILYDKETKPRYLALSPYGTDEARQGDSQWCFITAAKIIEDHGLAEKSPELKSAFAEMIPRIPSPGGESAAQLQQYHQILARLYGPHLDIDSYRQLIRSFGASEELEQKIFQEIGRILERPQLQSDLLSVYPDIIQTIKR